MHRTLLFFSIEFIKTLNFVQLQLTLNR